MFALRIATVTDNRRKACFDRRNDSVLQREETLLRTTSPTSSRSIKEKYPTLYSWTCFLIRLVIAFCILEIVNYYCGDVNDPWDVPSLRSRVARSALQNFLSQHSYTNAREFEKNAVGEVIDEVFCWTLIGWSVAFGVVFGPLIKKRWNDFVDRLKRGEPPAVLRFAAIVAILIVLVLFNGLFK
jgi:hypothetical protein